MPLALDIPGGLAVLFIAVIAVFAAVVFGADGFERAPDNGNLLRIVRARLVDHFDTPRGRAVLG